MLDDIILDDIIMVRKAAVNNITNISGLIDNSSCIRTRVNEKRRSNYGKTVQISWFDASNDF